LAPRDAGTGEQLLSKLSNSSSSTSKAQQHFEQQQHLQDGSIFGPKAPKATRQSAAEAQLHALLYSHSNTNPGFSYMLKTHAAVHDTAQQSSKPAGKQAVQSACESPLLRLLRRVSLWWYYRVMFDPLEQLVALSSSYELLFQLMTPHQQLSCMADILLVLACPALQEQRWGFSCQICRTSCT
jgi:hypothetical protein